MPVIPQLTPQVNPAELPSVRFSPSATKDAFGGMEGLDVAGKALSTAGASILEGQLKAEAKLKDLQDETKANDVYNQWQISYAKFADQEKQITFANQPKDDDGNPISSIERYNQFYSDFVSNSKQNLTPKQQILVSNKISNSFASNYDSISTIDRDRTIKGRIYSLNDSIQIATAKLPNIPVDQVESSIEEIKKSAAQIALLKGLDPVGATEKAESNAYFSIGMSKQNPSDRVAYLRANESKLRNVSDSQGNLRATAVYDAIKDAESQIPTYYENRLFDQIMTQAPSQNNISAEQTFEKRRELLKATKEIDGQSIDKKGGDKELLGKVAKKLDRQLILEQQQQNQRHSNEILDSIQKNGSPSPFWNKDTTDAFYNLRDKNLNQILGADDKSDIATKFRLATMPESELKQTALTKFYSKLSYKDYSDFNKSINDMTSGSKYSESAIRANGKYIAQKIGGLRAFQMNTGDPVADNVSKQRLELLWNTFESKLASVPENERKSDTASKILDDLLSPSTQIVDKSHWYNFEGHRGDVKNAILKSGGYIYKFEANSINDYKTEPLPSQDNQQPQPTNAGQFLSNPQQPLKENKPMSQLDQKLIDFVKDKEGFSEKAFGDYKQLSIGYGTRAKSMDEVVTKEQAEVALRKELSMHQDRILSAIEKRGWNLNQDQINALVSFDFNTGSGANLILTSRNLSELKSRFIQYNKAGGKVNKGLVDRRKAELDMIG